MEHLPGFYQHFLAMVNGKEKMDHTLVYILFDYLEEHNQSKALQDIWNGMVRAALTSLIVNLPRECGIPEEESSSASSESSLSSDY